MRTSFGHLVAVGRAQRHRRHVLARQRALDRERDAHRLAGNAESRHIETQQLDIGQSRSASHRHGEDRHAFQIARPSPPRHGGCPSFQSPSEASTIRPQIRVAFPAPRRAGRIQIACLARRRRLRKGLNHRPSNRSSSSFQEAVAVKRLDRLAPCGHACRAGRLVRRRASPCSPSRPTTRQPPASLPGDTLRPIRAG